MAMLDQCQPKKSIGHVLLLAEDVILIDAAP